MKTIRPLSAPGRATGRAPGRALILPLPFALLCACSNVTVSRVAAGDTSAQGVRYWMSAPYLLVTSPVVVSKSEAYTHAPSLSSKHAEVEALDASSTHSEPPPPPPLLAPRADGSKAGTHGAADAGAPPSLPSPPARTMGHSGSDRTQTSDSKTAPATDSSAAAAMSVTWLPDYCEQYAVTQSNVFSSSTFNLSLTNGWQLGGLSATSDPTAIVGKVMDTAAQLLGAKAQAAAATTVTSQAQGASSLALLVTTTTLPPGIYPLFKRENDDCSKPLKFAFDATKHTVTTVEIKSAP